MSQHTVAVIQARMGSSRLPGKILLPLNCEHVLTHDVRRVSTAERIDKIVIATSTETADDAVEQFGAEHDVPVYRGSEVNVQQRMFDAATECGADIIVRVTADCPLIDPDTIDTVVSHVHDGPAEYASNTIRRTFPRGLDVEAFSYESFERVVSAASTQPEREHVTPYYREQPSEFDTVNIASDSIFEDPQLQDRTDVRLTLDEADDYKVLREIYTNLPYDEILPIQVAIQYVDEHDLMQVNASVSQEEV